MKILANTSRSFSKPSSGGLRGLESSSIHQDTATRRFFPNDRSFSSAISCALRFIRAAMLLPLPPPPI
jgi:hypothetical protein